MPKYTVTKSLELEFICEAGSKQEAEELCIAADEEDMTLLDCQYGISKDEHPDTGMTTLGLLNKYSSHPNGHPDFPLFKWQVEARAGETLLGYYDWVRAQIEEYNHEDEDDE